MINIDALSELPSVPFTLRIPLAGRALGDKIFPHMAVNDGFAAPTLAALGDDGRRWVEDLYSVYGVLSRTQYVRRQALNFIAEHPNAHVINIGCGLSQYYQWLDNGHIHMIDVDLPVVIAMRQRLLPPINERQTMLAVDLTDSDWREQLQLSIQDNEPLLVIMEGVSMYLQAAQMEHILHTVNVFAPSGSKLVLDAFNYMAIGNACWHTSLRRTGADIVWGLRYSTDLTKQNPRLKIMEQADVMLGYSALNDISCNSVKIFTGLPFYAMYTLGID